MSYSAVDVPDATDATIRKVPTVPFAVKADDVAVPVESVVAVVAFVPFAKVPPAPTPGAVNVTVAPETGFPFDVTTAMIGDVNAVLTTVFCC
jgi:hypothetical protein